ncbi:MAG: hypothetical protein H0W71_06490 [Sphingomonas sp.]|nr:hypothetical protein [Sphingomonas sp.]
MTKLFLAAGVAALAIAVPAEAGPGGHGGKTERAQVDRGGARATARVERQSARPERQTMRADRQTVRADRQSMRADRQTMRADRQAMRTDRQAMRADRTDNRITQIDNRASRNLQSGVSFAGDNGWSKAKGRGFIEGCPPGLYMKINGCLPPGQAKKLIGSVLPAAIVSSSMPLGLSSLYPDNSNYYYRYNDGYMYQVDRGSNLINALLPLLGGGYLPGQYLPSNYMNSYVPSAYSSFYPNNQSQCTRYANGVIYYVDCGSGLIENFMPLYDNGYGVGQMLPSSYGYYNVPQQYRDMYHNSADTGYWYAPGAIYQYDQRTSLITSVAALLSPGMSIGQQLPTGYNAYNVPLGYRDTYYDTPDNWYRYSNGNIYQVDPMTQLVTALVASALT